MDFRILGPLEVADRGKALPLGGGRQRALLAVLLLHAGEAVSTERLIDELWGADPPGSALNSVHVYVSQLRKALGDGRIVTSGHGYALRVEDDELDLHRFERLLHEGRALLSRGESHDASSALAAGLSLWRGPPLADFASEEFAQEEIRRVEELRLGMLEERIEADLALGRVDDLVAELEVLVRANPLRERPRGQLMLALYRGGRQADALATYREGRRLLVEELGLEPGPALRDLEAAILKQDPALLAAAPADGRRESRRRGRLIAAGAALLLAASIAAAVVELTGGGGAGLAGLAANSIGVIDPANERIVASVPVPGGPGFLVVRGRTAWVESGQNTVSEVAPFGGGVSQVIPVGARFSGLAAGPGRLWVVSRGSGTLIELDPAYGTARRTVRIRQASSYLAGLGISDPWSVADGAGAVWVSDGSRRLARIDPATGELTRTGDLGAPLDAVAVGRGSVWAVSGRAASVIQLDPRTGRVRARIALVSRPNLESPVPARVAVGAGFVWVLNTNTATVTKIDPVQRGVSATIPLGVDRAPREIAAGAGAAWVGNEDGTLDRIDPATNAVRTLRLGREVADVAVGDDLVWVAVRAVRGPARPEQGPAAGPAQTLPSPPCSPIYYAGRETPQLLIAADLPLQGPELFETRPMIAAMTLELERRGFRAGPYRVGLQVCDDATPGSGFASQPKCAANARTFAANPSVIGVIGPFASQCARAEIPVVNRATGGALAMVSPTNTYVGLTRHSPETAAGDPDAYYPSGRRNYVRIVAADDFQGAADAILARRLGVKRIYVLESSSEYGAGIASEFSRVARKLGIAVVGRETWGIEAKSYAPLAADIAGTGADGVFLGGALSENGPTLLRDLRAGLGQTVQIIAPDGFTPGDTSGTAGAAAEGMTMSQVGIPNDRLGRAGQQFVALFSKKVGTPPTGFAVYAAQATDVLLDAIARSDGTRASVTKNLFRTKVSNGILGTFSITATGDTTANTVTIHRIVRGKVTTFAVIVVPERLVKAL